MLDETVATRPPWLDSSLTCLPWQVISVLHGIILQYLTGFAMRSCESIRAPESHAAIFVLHKNHTQIFFLQGKMSFPLHKTTEIVYN